MRTQNLPLLLSIILILPILFSCAHQISVVSCTSQVYYPGSEDQKPFQEVIVKLDTIADYHFDSLQFGKQTLPAKGAGPVLRFRADDIKPVQNAILYYHNNKKQRSIRIDSISRLKAMYLP